MSIAWTEYKLEELLAYEQPTAYIVNSTDYHESYKTPVLTAGKSFIIGYTDETSGVYDKLPVIIFDDFTTASQYVNFQFKVKSSAMKILTANPELVLPKFIFYRMQTIQFDHSTHKRYWIQQYSQIKVKVPPLPEQERIVAKIEELFSQLDAAVAELKSVKEKLAIYRQAVLKEAFEKYNKGMVQLKHIAVSRLGKMLDKSKNTGNTHKYLRNINVRWLGFDTTDLLDIKIEDYEVEKFSIAFDDLIMCEGGEPGRCAVWKNKESICFQKALHRIRFLDDSIPEFYMYLFYYYAQTGVLKPYFTGSGIKHLTGEKLETVLVPKAPRDEQNSTVNYIEKKLSICNNIEQNVDTALQRAAAFRQSILKQAFEGNL